MKEKILMPPLWLAYPYIRRYSIGWRMGLGEDYASKFGRWFNKLSENDKQEYITLFPEPKIWGSVYNNEEESEEMYFMHNEFVQHWQKNGRQLIDIEALKQKHNNGEKIDYLFFWGHRASKNKSITKSCLSQWWKSSFSENITNYNCMEQYMMSKKALLFDDKDINNEILNSDDPNMIKKLGRKVKNFNSEIWDKAKYSIVLNGNYLKFTQNRNLMKFLLSTGDKILVEASPYDNIWGINMSDSDDRVNDPNLWRGSNLLGFALTEVREEIKRVYKNESLLDYSFVEQKSYAKPKNP